jgi:hypothetical protein
VLVVTGLVIEAQTHICRNEFCPKADRHYTDYGNHWTQAYNIGLVALQNVTPLPKKSRPKMSPTSRDILSESRVPKCHANLGIGNPAPLGSEDEASALTSGSELVSEQVSELSEADASPALPTEEHTTPFTLPNQGATVILHNIYPVRNEKESILPFAATLNDLVEASPEVDWNEFFAWHRTHKPPKLHYRTVAKFIEGVTYSLNDYAYHDPATCAVCKKLGAAERPGPCAPEVWCAVCGKTKPVRGQTICVACSDRAGGSFSDLCAECGWNKQDCTCPVPVGKGFDVEEAE